MATTKKTPKTRVPKAKPVSPIFEAIEAYALALQSYNEAIAVASEAGAVLIMAREGLARFGIYISNEPPADKTFPFEENEVDYGGDDPLDDDDEPEGFYAPARGPAVNRAPSETEVEKIRSASYAIGGEKKVDPDDSSALTAMVGETMGGLMKDLTRGGGKMTVGPAVIPEQPVHHAGETAQNPHEKNQHGGPVEQRPL
jgi:hypothetical protein